MKVVQKYVVKILRRTDCDLCLIDVLVVKYFVRKQCVSIVLLLNAKKIISK